MFLRRITALRPATIVRNKSQSPCASNEDQTAKARFEYSASVEQQMNMQICNELRCSHVYLSMAGHFGSPDRDLRGTAAMFLKMSNEEREHGICLINYQNLRGGRVCLTDIMYPENSEWTSLDEALLAAMSMERENSTSLLKLYTSAEKEHDPQTSDFILQTFLNEQTQSINDLARLISRVTLVGPGLGLYSFDKDLQKVYGKKIYD